MQQLPSKQPTPESSQSSDARQSKGNPNSTPSTSDRRDPDHASADNDSEVAEGGEYGFVELTLISAQGLKDVKMFGSMSPYAVVYIDPSCKHRTCISDNTGSSPVWDYYLCLPIPAIENPKSIIDTDTITRIHSIHNDDQGAGKDGEDDDHQRLTIQIFSQGVVSDVLVGTAHIPLHDIIQNAAGKLQYLACQLVRPSGRIQGLVNLSVQFKPPLLPHDFLCHLHGKATSSQIGQSRNSWFFIADGVEDDSGRETGTATLQGRPIAAPDFLDFKAEREGAGTGGASQSSSSPNESVNASTGHSPISPHSGFRNVPLSHQPHQHQHQQACASKAMFDSACDALVVADVANDVASMSLLQADRGSQNIGDALLGLAMSQSLQGNNAPFGPSSSSQ